MYKRRRRIGYKALKRSIYRRGKRMSRVIRHINKLSRGGIRI